MKLSDYVWRFLADHGVRDVFLLTGGGAMHLNDSLGQEKRLRYICCHHEQACAMAAEGYARIAGHIGVVNVTTGPGGINALNGIFGAWTDSIPMLVISGQVKRETCMGFHQDVRLRQLGDQEVDIIGMVRGITKYATLVKDARSIRYHLEKALHFAENGRPGPCWIDIPMDIQSADIVPEELRSFSPAVRPPLYTVSHDCEKILDMLALAKRPVIMAGSGVRIADAVDIFRKVAAKLRIPVVTAWTHDIIPSDDVLYCGRPGTIGTRPGNFVVQNADLLLVIGSRLNIRQTSYNWNSFAKNARIIQVDVDEEEMRKPTRRPNWPIVCDARVFLEKLDRAIASCSYVVPASHEEWLGWCRERMVRYPSVLPKHRGTTASLINPYFFMQRLFELLAPDDIIVTANATACIVSFQVGELKEGQRLFSNSGSASMGYDLPAAIGAAVAGGGRRVVCLAGDGSIQLNIQELQTVRHHGLPIKIFVLNNNGYLSIRSTQSNFFKRLVGEGPSSGVSFPDYVSVARAYGLEAYRIEGEDFEGKLKEALSSSAPSLYEVMLDPEQGFEPRISSRQLPDGTIVSPELEDMFPFLDRSELAENCICEIDKK